MLEKTRTKQIRKNKRKTEILSELINHNEKEFKLILDEDKTSIKITTETGKTIELKPKKNENLKINKQNQPQTTIPQKELVNKIEEKLGEKINTPRSRSRKSNILAILLKLKALLKQYEINQDISLDSNY